MVANVREKCDEIEFDGRDEVSPSSSGTGWYSSRCKEFPDGRVADSEPVYVHPGCSAGSLNSCIFDTSNVPGTVRQVFCEESLWPDGGRAIFCLTCAFFKLAGHHSSRSVEREPLELLGALEVSMDGGLADRSLALRSLRDPKVSGSFSNGRSVANMVS